MFPPRPADACPPTSGALPHAGGHRPILLLQVAVDAASPSRPGRQRQPPADPPPQPPGCWWAGVQLPIKSIPSPSVSEEQGVGQPTQQQR